MTTLLLAICGPLVVAMVVVGMVLITPSGTEDVHVVGQPAHGSNLSPVAGADAEPGQM
jgi:preprotein translocase subunit SecG